ncbi:MAG TPA: hypothetical protein DCY13_18005 [Verrucomicrobiales bacterium]|nr:hypothetical protein [Verrucomicrobiales bacterium]
MRSRWLLTLTILIALLLSAEATAGVSVRVAWDPNPENNIAGYRIYHGVVGLGQTNVLDVGPVTTGTVTNLAFTTPHWFFVTAYNTFALESDPSEVLFHTTRAAVPLGVETDTALLVFSPTTVQLNADVTGDVTSPLGRTVEWRMISGFAPLVIAGSSTLNPSFDVDVPGYYSLLLRVADGLAVVERQINIEVFDRSQGSGGGAAPVLEPPFLLPDGLLIGWSSVPDGRYYIGRRRSLDDTHWVILARALPSQGYSTYWVDDSGLTLSAGFYSIFNLP